MSRTKPPLAWRVEVRSVDPARPSEWRLYGTYESRKAAEITVKRGTGWPLQHRIVPLVAAREDTWTVT